MLSLETFLISAGILGGFIVLTFVFWSIFWKAIALWVAAREGKKWWFIIIVLINIAGILEIIYLVFFSETGKKYIQKIRHKINKKHKDQSVEEKGDSSEQ